MYKCQYCDKEFDKFQSNANHVRWTHKRDEVDTENFRNKLSESCKKAQTKIHGDWVEEIVKCDNPNGCSINIKIKYRQGKKPKKSFCSRSCANSRVWTEDRHKKHMERYNDPNDIYGQGFKSNIGNISNPIFSSKNERLIIKYFKENYPNDGWKSGGCLNINGIKLARDMWSDKLKICFEYDGVWHFVNIFNQLKDKQEKDNALEIWCMHNNYRLIRIDELKFRTPKQIVNLIYDQKEQIIKIGDRY